jgi:hypothetical protein
VKTCDMHCLQIFIAGHTSLVDPDFVSSRHMRWPADWSHHYILCKGLGVHEVRHSLDLSSRGNVMLGVQECHVKDMEVCPY